VNRHLPEKKVRTIFATLVEVQDSGTSVADSRHRVAQRLGVRLEDVELAETLGLENSWPPLTNE
jgi:hypothetical protein